jgi:hypothetical protein
MNDDKLTYNLIASDIVNRENVLMEEAFAENRAFMRWSQIGLLDGIDNEEDQITMAVIFEKALQLLTKGEKEFAQTITVTFLPVLRRLFMLKKLNPCSSEQDITLILNDFQKFVLTDEYAYNIKIYNERGEDGEALLLTDYCDTFQLEKLKV